MHTKPANLALWLSLLLALVVVLAIAFPERAPAMTPAPGTWDLEAATVPAKPNYTLVEPGLYVGGDVTAPPPEVQAVLNLSLYEDEYTAPIQEWQPIPDAAPAPSEEWLRQQVAFIDTQRRAGKTVFVHCAAGISRSGMVTAAYLMWRNHWTREQALVFLRETRPIIDPNDAFMELLKQWEETLESEPAMNEPM